MSPLRGITHKTNNPPHFNQRIPIHSSEMYQFNKKCNLIKITCMLHDDNVCVTVVTMQRDEGVVEHPNMVRKVVGSNPHSGSIEGFLIATNALRLV